MIKKLLSLGVFLSLLALPLISFAQEGDLKNLNELAIGLGNVVSTLTTVAFAAALLFFFWGLATFILASGDEEAKEKGKNRMIWGIIAFFVMVSIWGIVRWIGDATGVEEETTITVPTVPGVGDK